MRHKWFVACLSSGAILVFSAFVFLSTKPIPAETDKPGEKETPLVRVTQLPIGQVVLFSSGVGYFQREGTVEGNARVDLSFPVTDINDLLKSMVLRDLNGGHISTVSYDSNAPIEHTLKSFAVNLTSNPSFAQILNQARGEKVEVVMQQANAIHTGTLIGCEKQEQAVGKDKIEVELLNLWCADGMRNLKLSEVQRIHFLNPVLDSEFQKALETLARSHDKQKKSVAINFTGEGKREVRVGYVVENPIWKTSYRLVLDKKTQKPFLQGWAIVENTTDEDWKDVRMTLVSGRPISFQMDLYQPLYVTRPVVEMELFASVHPVTYSGDLKDGDAERNGEEGRKIKELRESGLGGRSQQQGQQGQGQGKGQQDRARRLQNEAIWKKSLNDRMDLGASVSAAASASKPGDFFQYVIDEPVSLVRQKSALLPLLNKEIEGTRISIYNEQTLAKFPLLGLKFKNTTGLHLAQGPVAVFEGSNYAGDAHLLDLQPNEERLISYAIDLGTEVNPQPVTSNSQLTQLKAVKGILHMTHKLRESKTYTIKNCNDQERLVLVEHPVRNNFKLISEVKPAETARDFYRFQVKVAPGKTETLMVTEEMVQREIVQLTNLDDNRIRFFINENAISDKVKSGLQRAMELRNALAKTQQEISELQGHLQAITEDQPRLRANLKELPQTSEIFQRIVKKFNEQETQIEKYQADIKRLQDVEHDRRKAFEDFLTDFNAE